MSALTLAHRVAGGLGLAAGVLALLGAQVPLLEFRAASGLGSLLGEAPASVPDVPAARWAALAGVLLALVSLGLFRASRAEQIRPAVSVLWAALLPAAFATLHTVSAAVDASKNPDPFVRLAAPVLGFGPGVWFVLGAVGSACATGLACLVAGVLDREAWENARELAISSRVVKRGRDQRTRRAAETAEEEQPERSVVITLAIAGGCGVSGLLLPLYCGPGFCSAWLPDVPFVSEAFGQFVLAVVVGSAAVVGTRARRGRRIGLFAGAAASLVVYIAGYPFVSSRVDGSVPGPGFWLSLVGAVVFTVAMGQAWRRNGDSLGSPRRVRTKTRR